MADDRDCEIIDGVQVGESEKAWLLEVAPMGEDKPRKIWLPKSQVSWAGKNKWSVPLWLAEKNGLV